MNQKDIVQFNCNGIRGHYNLIKQLLHDCTPKFVLLQELKMKKNEKITFKGYTLLRKNIDDDSSFLPSVGILIKDGILYEEIQIPAQNCVIGINTFCVHPISLFSYYDSIRIGDLNEAQLKRIVDLGKNKAIIMGDFNAKSYLWDNNRKRTYNNDVRASHIINFVNNHDYVILNNGASTRISSIFNQKNSAIDLTIISQNLASTFSWSVSNSTYGSDHLPTFLTTTRIANSHVTHIWDINNTDWKFFNVHCKLDAVFENEDNIDSIDNNVQFQLINGLEHSTPHIKCDPSKRKIAPWWDDDLKQLKRDKIKLLKKYTRDQTI